MAKITSTFFPETDLTIFTMEGSVTLQDMMDLFQSLRGTVPTRNVIWDASNGSVGEITSSGLRTIAEFSKRGTGMRANGKTAMVGASDLNFGMGRMFEAFADIVQLSVPCRTFKSLEEALAWIKSDTQQG